MAGLKSHDWPLTQEEKCCKMKDAYQCMVERKMGKGFDMVIPGCVCSLFDEVINHPKEEQEPDSIMDLEFPISNPSNPSTAYSAELNGPNTGNLLFQYCKSDPCHTFTFGNTIKDQIGLLDHDKASNVLCNVLYQAYVREVRGGLGREIKFLLFPSVSQTSFVTDPNRHYMGHKSF